LGQGWDVVCGSRYMAGGKKIGGPALQDFGSRFINATLFRLGFPTSDATNSFKLYRRKFLAKLSPAPFVSMETSFWLILQAYWHGGWIADVPTTWKGRTAGHAKITFWKRSVRYLVLFIIAIAVCLVGLLRKLFKRL